MAATLWESRMTSSLLTDIGGRATNEDSGRIVRPADPAVLAAKGVLVLVADGMGGHLAGEVASRLAADIVQQLYYDNPAGAAQSLEDAFHEANKQIYDAASQKADLKGMGTTCTALVLLAESAICAHVGDSRLYLRRDGRLRRMTEDHSVVQHMIDNGLISCEEARGHPDKNVILRALGTQRQVDVATWDGPMPVAPGDQFLLCSDGLHDLVLDEEIGDVLDGHCPRDACSLLVALAKAHGAQDNITVAVVHVEGSTMTLDDR
jgi:serine/threonine protein phosphatase PrpC